LNHEQPVRDTVEISEAVRRDEIRCCRRVVINILVAKNF
jgi:hypothetical protein